MQMTVLRLIVRRRGRVVNEQDKGELRGASFSSAK